MSGLGVVGLRMAVTNEAVFQCLFAGGGGVASTWVKDYGAYLDSVHHYH